jgi:Ca2+-binding EF-hand superfamily protein
MLDGDRNGQITKEELREAFETQSVKDDEMWNRIMSEVDKNKNGTIDYDEFSEVMNRIVSSQYKNLANVLEVVSLRLKKQFGRKLALPS